MPEFHLTFEKSIESQLQEIRKLPAGTVIRFDDSIDINDQNPRILELINGVLPHLQSGHIFPIDINFTRHLAELVGRKLAKNTILKVVYPIVPEVAIAAVKELDELNTLWISVENEQHVAAMKKLSPVPLAKIIAAGKPGLRVQLPAYLSSLTSRAAVHALPDEGTLKLPEKILFEEAIALVMALKPGQKLSLPNAMPFLIKQNLAALLPAGCGLEISLKTRNARALVAELKKSCFVKFCYFQGEKQQTEYALTDPGLSEKLLQHDQLFPLRKALSQFFESATQIINPDRHHESDLSPKKELSVRTI